MQYAIDAAEVDECAIACDIFHRAFENHPLFKDFQNLLFEESRSFSKSARRETTTLPRGRLYFTMAKRSVVPMNLIQVAIGTNVDMGTRQKCRHADINFETALDLAQNMTFDAATFIEGLFDVFPDFNVLRALARQHNAAVSASEDQKRHPHRRRLWSADYPGDP